MPYFDHNATTPLLPVAREAWLRAMGEAWQNPSSPYRVSARVHRLLEEARARIAVLLGVPSGEIVFTSGATEANNAVIAWAARTLPRNAPVLVSPTEHPSVLEPMREHFGERVRLLPVDRDGRVNVESVEAGLAGAKAGVVAVMAANNETGVLQTAARAIAGRAQAHGAIFLCDASQWIGRISAAGLPAGAFWVGCAHKFGGPKGVGFLRVPATTVGFSGQRGGEQERAMRGGTENYPAIAAMVAALEYAAAPPSGERQNWNDTFCRDIVRRVSGARVNGANAPRLWNTVSLCLPAHENTRWVARLDKLGFEVSTGSACATGSDAPSHVLAAMGLTSDEARRTIRVSSGWETTGRDWELLAAAIENVWQQLQAEGSDSGVVIA